MSRREPEAEPSVGNMIRRALVIAAIVSAVLIVGVILLDFFGAQLQPFQYLLH